MPRSPNLNWTYVGFPKFLVERVDVTVEKDKYPEGRWHSRQELVIIATKWFLNILDSQAFEEVKRVVDRLETAKSTERKT